MANTREIRRRIRSVKNTAQITKAMQMVATSKMRRAQQAAVAGHPYADQMNKILTWIRQAEQKELLHPFFENREQKRPCVLLITTDKGLCGPLNSNLLREVLKLPPETQFVTIGKKGRQFIVRTKRNLLAEFNLKDNASFAQVKQISQFLIDKFLAKEIDSISVLFSQFTSVLVQTPTLDNLVPIARIREMEVVQRGKPAPVKPLDENPPNEYLFEPTPHAVLNTLLPAYVNFIIYQTFLDAKASEHSARMVAMKSATDNAKQMVKDLTLEFNKARQAAITNELLDITTAQLSMN